MRLMPLANFVPTDRLITNSLLGLSAGNFVIKATPTATLVVSNSPQTYTGETATVTISASSVPGAVPTSNRTATQTNNQPLQPTSFNRYS
jgi:hypothetical protein